MTKPKGIKVKKAVPNKKGKLYKMNDAVEWIKGKYQSEKTQRLYIDNLAKICRHCDNENINDLFGDPKPFLEKLKSMTYERDDTKLVSPESIKSYLILVRTLTKDNKVPSVDDKKQQVYNNEMIKYAKLTEHDRGKNEKKGNLAKNPDVNWNFIVKKRNEFEKTKMMAADNLYCLTLISLNTLIRPRRLDARHIKVYHKQPKAADITPTSSYVIVGGREMKICYGEFKTRIRMGKEIMKPFKRTLPPTLTSLIRQYVKKNELNDGDYLFYNGDKKNQFKDSSFSKQLGRASTKVIGVYLTGNDFRHAYIDFIADHFKEYNDNDLKQISFEMGDFNVYTALKYRFANKLKENDTVTQINDRIIEERELEANRLIHQEEEGSRMLQQDEEEESVDMPLREEDEIDIMDRTTMPLPPQGDKEIGQILDEMYAAMKPYLMELMMKLK
jgi:hypothetical protein